jgi:hypothetical protein
MRPAAGNQERPAKPWTPEDNLRLSIRMGLAKGLCLVRGLRQQLDEDDRNRVAEAIREHLQLAGWRIAPGPGIGGYSQLSGGSTESDRK